MNRRGFLQSAAALAAISRMSLGREPEPNRFDAAKSFNQFTWDLFARVRGEQGNQFLSPFSISTALAMTSLGARGRTRDQMNTLLHLPEDAQTAHAAIAQLQKRLNAGGAERGYQLAVANALWGAKNYEFLPQFLEQTREHYGAGLTSLDFENAAEQSRTTINSWVEKQTRDRIKNLLPEGSISSDTRLVLTNAIYFKGDWATQFSKSATKEELFHVTAEKSARTPMMRRTGDYGYFANDKVQVLSAPYKGRELAMMFVLPLAKHGLAEVEKNLAAADFDRWASGLRATNVIVTLPKFKMTNEYKLVPTLRDMGAPAPFSASADFSGMSAKEGLLISDVFHKAFVEVNEEGAEAAAATGVVVKPTSARIPDPKPTPVFRADHPFLFVIRDQKSGCILFVGRVADPSR